MQDGGSQVVLGLVAAPGTPAAVAAELAEEIPALLAERLPGADWRVALVTDSLVSPPANDDELVGAARQRLLDEAWDLAVVLTDLPLTVRRRPVVAHASPVHGIAVVSVPALGPVGVRRRARDTVLPLVHTLLGDPDGAGGPARGPGGDRQRLRARLHRLGTDRDAGGGDRDGSGTVQFARRVLGGNLRLLAGMVRANQPWRLAAGLSRALVAAMAAGVFAVVTPDIWRLADAFGSIRLVALGSASVVATGVTLIVGAGLWERTRGRAARQQVVLFNLATTATVLIGVVSLYAALFGLAMLTSGLLVVPSVLGEALGHHTSLGEFAEVAWFASSLAMVGGALGAGLETDEAVRAAAYTYRPSGAAIISEGPQSHSLGNGHPPAGE